MNHAGRAFSKAIPHFRLVDAVVVWCCYYCGRHEDFLAVILRWLERPVSDGPTVLPLLRMLILRSMLGCDSLFHKAAAAAVEVDGAATGKV